MYDVDFYFFRCDAQVNYSIRFTDTRLFPADPRDQTVGPIGNGMCQSMLIGVDIELGGLKAGILGGRYPLFHRRGGSSVYPSPVPTDPRPSIRSSLVEEQIGQLWCRIRRQQLGRDHLDRGRLLDRPSPIDCRLGLTPPAFRNSQVIVPNLCYFH